MAAPGSGLTATGLAVTVIAVSVGVSSTGGFFLPLSFAGVLAGASLIFVGVRVADDDPTAPIGRPGVLAAGVVHCLRRNIALVGLLLASSAAASATAATADREAAPVLCFCAFAVMLLGLSLLNTGVLLLGEQEH
ncbi:unnamed protein product [Miscanthus lutarioriparius]|uniref:Uncharacterized protein n=1 Tax=Miscanthus lutarioriparius TaxID=422564 RepID=A0A811RU86_9POAL|nr:unnamed protein product [Miscanthus lutarioriparius]